MIHALAQLGDGVLCGYEDSGARTTVVAVEVQCEDCKAALVELGALPEGS